MTTYNALSKFAAAGLAGGTVKVLLLTDSFAGVDASHWNYEFVSDVVAAEVSATGYARQTVAGSVSSDADGAYFAPTSSTLDFSAMTADVRYLAFYIEGVSDAASRIIGIAKLDAVLSLAAKVLRLTFTGNLFEVFV